MNYCRDCRWMALGLGLERRCVHPKVCAHHASPVDGAPESVACRVEREPYREPLDAVCGRTGLAFERRDPSRLYRFFLWLFGGPAR